MFLGNRYHIIGDCPPVLRWRVSVLSGRYNWRRLWVSAQARAPLIIEKHLRFHRLLPPFPPIFWVAPNIFDQSTPVDIYYLKWKISYSRDGSQWDPMRLDHKIPKKFFGQSNMMFSIRPTLLCQALSALGSSSFLDSFGATSAATATQTISSVNRD